MIKTVNKNALLFLISFLCVTSTLIEPLMGWVIVLIICVSGILLYNSFQPNVKRIENRLLNLLAVFCLVILILFSGQFGLLNTMINLLMVACCLKMINLQFKPDYQAVCITLIFLIACGMIFNQGIGHAILYIVCFVLILLILNNNEFFKLNINIRRNHSLYIFLQALPIAVLLFLVTPQLTPLWKVPKGKGTETGLAEQVTPGDIANLAQSDELSFRAEFFGNVPTYSERYWRAIVLDFFDGQTWSISSKDNNHYLWSIDNMEKRFVDYFFDYTVIAEPNNTRWLYSLDVPLIAPEKTNRNQAFTSQYQIKSRTTNFGQILYSLRSYPNLPLNLFSDDDFKSRYLQLPDQSNPRTRELVETIITQDMMFLDKINVLKEQFTLHPFSYTLKPPFMPVDSIDTFMFDEQAGFCSHYASALTFMLRLAGVPSRLVTGYQGGDEQIKNVLSIYQFDAHAWVEAWDSEMGWIRLDPTAWVAPDRISMGIRESLENRDEFLEEQAFSLAKFEDFLLVDMLRSAIEKIDHEWSQKVLGFNQDKQKNLIKDLFGRFDGQVMTWVLVISFIVIGLFVGTIFYIKTLKRPSNLEILHQRFLKKTNQWGFKKQRSETMSQFIVRILASQKFNRDSTNLEAFYKEYEQVVFASTHISNKRIKSLTSQVKNL